MSKRLDFLSRYATLTAVATFLLLIAGGLVTSTDSGLAVPDWPLSYGTLFPPMVGGILYEHTHRLIAAMVGLMIASLAGWLWFTEPRRWVRRLGYLALVAVLTQAILGGLTVLWVLPPAISIAHACLGQVVFCLVVCLAVVTSPTWQALACDVDDPLLRRLCIATTTLVFLQILLGAIIRHSGLALVPHLVGAGLVMAMAGLVVARATRRRSRWPWFRRVAVMVGVGLVGQMILGLSVWSHRGSIALTTAHVVMGALLLAGCCVLTLMTWRLGGTSRLRWFRVLRQRLIDYLALTKPRLTLLALAATGVGFLMGSSHPTDWRVLIQTLVGAALVGGGANALNQWAERDVDALMNRTKSRPLPAGRLQPIEALLVGLITSGFGILLLGSLVNGLAALLAIFTLISYVGLYTPLKRKTALCTLVGAIPGALPPLIGWAAARGQLGLEAWVLFAILFLWQLPHFLAIAWVHRDDYARAGFQMLPVIEPDGASTARQMIVYGLALLVTSLFPTIMGVAGPLYFVGAAAAGVWFFSTMISAARGRSCALANRLFLVSVVYLPIVLLLMVVDKTPL